MAVTDQRYALAKRKRERAFSTPAPARFGVKIDQQQDRVTDFGKPYEAPILTENNALKTIDRFIGQMGRRYSINIAKGARDVARDTVTGGEYGLKPAPTWVRAFVPDPMTATALYNVVANEKLSDAAAPLDFAGTGALARFSTGAAVKGAKATPSATRAVGRAAAAGFREFNKQQARGLGSGPFIEDPGAVIRAMIDAPKARQEALSELAEAPADTPFKPEIPLLTLAAANYGKRTPVDPAWVSAALNKLKQLQDVRVERVSETVAGEKAAQVGIQTQGRAMEQAIEQGALIPTGTRKIGDKTFGLGILEKSLPNEGYGLPISTKMQGEYLVADIKDIKGPFAKGQQELSDMMINGGLLDPSATPNMLPMSPEEKIRAGVSLKTARGEDIAGFKAQGRMPGGVWVNIGTDEVDHNPVGQRALYWSAAEFLDTAKKRGRGAARMDNARQQVWDAYAILSGRLDRTTRAANQAMGSYIRSGAPTDKAYLEIKDKFMFGNMLRFLDQEGNLLSIHRDNWNMLELYAPDIAKIIIRQMEIPPTGIDFGNPRATPGRLF